MSKSVRIRTTPNGKDKYVKVELKQDFDLLEILSLKIKQEDVYGNFCSDHGVVAGRVIINNGFGVPNVKVSIFIPKNSNNPIVEQLYPFDSPSPEKKNVNGIRYNLLPDSQQTLDHTPVGTFPDKIGILDDKINLEIYERYYKYTTTTNESGDFILFGVPTGNQTLHYDMDVSDIGFISARPYELIEQGYAEELFASPFKFKSSRNLDSLTQIVSQNINVLVQPFWCDSLSTGRVIGITREDISIDSIELTPTAMFFGSVLSDDEKDSVNKNCRPRKKMGRMEEMITGKGQVEAIYRTIDGDIEKYDIDEDAIDENGTFALQLPMNLRKVVTDEFGNLVPSPDGIKGIATEADFRFRISMDATGNDKRLRRRASFLVPNLTGNYKFDNYDLKELQEEKPYKINRQLSTFTENTPYSGQTNNQYNYLEDFYTLRWKKVYTVKQFISRYQSNKKDRNRNFIGIKRIEDGAGTNKFPINRLFTKINAIYSIFCFVLTAVGIVIAFINGILNYINSLITSICQIPIICGLKVVSDIRIRYGNHGCSNVSCSSSINIFNFQTYIGLTKKIGFTVCLKLKLCFRKKCVFGGWLCKRCNDTCFPDTNPGHSCCRDISGPGGQTANDNENCTSGGNDRKYGCPTNDCALCIDGTPSDNKDRGCCRSCCTKINLIALNCPEDNAFPTIRPSLIFTPLARNVCNETFVKINSCKECSGSSTPQIKEWVKCKLEGVANWLNMIRFEFYNDWVSGTLYFPLIKRKYKLKKRKKKRGQLKKDKFCDFDCAPDYQTPNTYNKYRVIVENTTANQEEIIDVNGCRVRIRGSKRYVTPWFGKYVPNGNAQVLEDIAILNAKESLKFTGVDTASNPCTLRFDDPLVFQAFDDNANIEIRINDSKTIKTFPGPHGRPNYVEVEDPVTGLSVWENRGGHSHHKNKCNTVYRVEKEEYFRSSVGCQTDLGNNNAGSIDADFITSPPDPETQPGEDIPNNLQPQSCPPTGCIDPCQSAVQGCTNRCPCTQHNSYNDKNIKHGIIAWEDGKIYYASVMKKPDAAYNTLPRNYKANLLYPTDLVEMGSSVYCDIDDVPFVINDLEPTTSRLSEEGLKYDFENQNANPIVVNSVEEKDGIVNLRAYVSFGCTRVNCLNTTAGVVQSQVGIDLIDSNDLGMEVGQCFTYYEHDSETRDYFCRRFSTFKNDDLEVNYMRPGSNEFDNLYDVYPSAQFTSGIPSVNYSIDGVLIPNSINDGDEFVTGDRCGLKSNGKFFYGTGWKGGNNPFPSEFLDFPNMSNINDKTNPQNFGVKYSTSQTPYYHYFGLVPGKSALHRLVSKYFADKIDEVTLQGLGNNEKAGSNTYNQPGFRDIGQNKFTALRSCLGEAVITSASESAAISDLSNSGVISLPNGNAAVGKNSGGASSIPNNLKYQITGVNEVGNTNTFSTDKTNNFGQASPTKIIVTSPNAELKIEISSGSVGSGLFGMPLLTTGTGKFIIYNDNTTTPVNTNVISTYGSQPNTETLISRPLFAFTSTVTEVINFTIKQTGTYNVYLEYVAGSNNTNGYIKIT